MRSIRTKYTLMTVCAIVAALGIATLIAVVSIRKLGRSDGDQMLSLMCATGAMNLESYFDSVEQSVEIVSTVVQGNLKEVPLEQLGSQVERSRNLFVDVARNTNGVLTYYFRIDPELSKTEKGFWYVNLDGKGFKEHAVTDISQYDTSDTHSLVWFTIPKATGKGVWLPPYRTENLDVLVISYNVPIYRNETFVGVIGIEIDYETLAHEVENIRLLEDGYAFLIDADSNVIYHPKMDSILIYEHKAIPLPEELRGDNTHIQYKYEGIDKEAVWRPLLNGMRLYVTVPVSRINSAWQDMIWEILLASLILLVLAVTVTLRFTGHLTKPLLELTKAAKKVSDGNYEFTLDYDKNDEIGILTQTFRQLASSTKEHINSLNQQVFVDALTSVRNRGGHVNYLQKMQDQMDASEEPMEFAIGAFDCDNLKTINDTYGHEKGDIYLKTASRLICRIFQHSPVFRIGGDEFSVILQNSDYQNREELFSLFRKSEEEINEAAESPWEEVKVTFGIAVYDPKRDTSVNDVARRADQIMYENKRIRKEKQNRERSANVSADETFREVDISKYVVENLDRAIENKWLKVYYQPVIRSLTGALCSMESLVRWQDPMIGFLKPVQFIAPLEKNHLIYRVDQYVVEQVCADLHERLRLGKPIVPVSINCSRQDFTLCNMLEVVEQAVARYELPREYLHIEITESMIASDESLMRRVINDFRKAGYEVWMDDFGSGYSSLTFLKDYPFDLLKLDMSFLSSFTDRSKKLLRAIVLMAKELRIKTLAEGVETREELVFLKEIGCERIQGYYYGKPQPLNKMFAHLEATNVPVETMEQGRYYETACEHIKPTDVPLEIIEDDGENFRTLYMNKAYKRQIFDDDPDLEEADRRIYHLPSPLLKKYREFAEKLEKSGQEETFYYTGVGSYLRFQAQVLGELDGRFLLKGSIINLSMDEDKERTEGFDIRLRELNQLFEAVHLIDLQNDRLTPMFGEYKFYADYDPKDAGLRAQLRTVTEKRIAPDEKDAFAAFMDIDSLLERIGKSDSGYITAIFHVLQKDGGYKPEEFTLMPIPGSRGNEFLFCTKLRI